MYALKRERLYRIIFESDTPAGSGLMCGSCGADMQVGVKYCSNCGVANEQKVGQGN